MKKKLLICGTSKNLGKYLSKKFLKKYNVIQLSTKNIIEFKDVSFNYEDKPIYSNLNMSMGMGSRIILVGPNGCGKTTMFKLACEMIQPTSGHIVRDERLRVGYYNQQIVDSLPLELNSIEYLQTINDKLDHNQCRTILGKLGIKSEFDSRNRER